MLSRISQRIRSRRDPWIQAFVRSTTQRTAPRPEPCGVPRWAMTGLMPRCVAVSGMSVASQIAWCLEPGCPRSTGLRPVVGRP